MLAACGGGGGAGGAPSPGNGGATAPANDWLSFSPAVTEVSIYEGQQQSFKIVATSSKIIEGTFNIGIIDSKGVVEPNVDVSPITALSYSATLRTAKALSVGTFEGNFELRLCRDTPTVCAQPIDGSPWKLPYKITVKPGSNLTPLSSLPGATGWSGYQGGSDHAGVVNATISASAITRRWVKPLSSSGLATDGGKVFLTPLRDTFGALIAVSELDGAELWRANGNGVWYSTPAARDGRVWALNAEGGVGLSLVSLDASSGGRVSIADVPSSYRTRLFAPVVEAGGVYVGSDEGRTYRYSASSGRQVWRGGPAVAPNPVESGEFWTPAVADGRVVSFDGNQLWLSDAASGTTIGRIDGPNPNAASSNKVHTVGTAVVLGSGDRAFLTSYVMASVPAGRVDTGTLAAFDLRKQSLLWSIRSDVRSNPVLSDGVVYVVLDRSALLAVDASTGKELWVWDSPSKSAVSMGVDAPLLVIGNYAFVGLAGVTYAVDLKTHAAVWQYPQEGPMAVSANGVLYIGGGALAAFNLR